MNDGQNAAQPESVIPNLTAEPTQLARPPVPVLPKSPQEAGVWAVPPETASLLRDLDVACGALLQKIGSMEVEYLAAKYATIDELKAKRGLFKNLVDEAARKAGLDIDKSRWSIDARTMTLVRSS
jgi:hypothetical protein